MRKVKGIKYLESGYVYAPYVPLQVSQMNLQTHAQYVQKNILPKLKQTDFRTLYKNCSFKLNKTYSRIAVEDNGLIWIYLGWYKDFEEDKLSEACLLFACNDDDVYHYMSLKEAGGYDWHEEA